MNISRNDLYRIVLEEYLLEEGHAGTDTAVEDLLKKILGDKYKPPEERDPNTMATQSPWRSLTPRKIRKNSQAS